MSDAAAWIAIPLQIFFVDLLLGADNAVVIALACQSLPPRETRKAIVFGTAGAILMRLALTTFANAMLAVPFVKLLGAGLLLLIALNVTTDSGAAAKAVARRASASGDFVAAAFVITIADAAMSLDNVVALAAIARGSFWLLAAGVAASIPILAYGGLMLTSLISRAPLLAILGAALLGWIAGDMAASDPSVADWANVNAPALAAIAPVLGCAFVLANLLGRAPAPRPALPAPSPRAQQAAAKTRPDPAPPTRPRDVAPHRDDDVVRMGADGDAPAPRTPEERAAVIGLVVLAVVAGLIILIASYYDSLT